MPNSGRSSKDVRDLTDLVKTQIRERAEETEKFLGEMEERLVKAHKACDDKILKSNGDWPKEMEPRLAQVQKDANKKMEKRDQAWPKAMEARILQA